MYAWKLRRGSAAEALNDQRVRSIANDALYVRSESRAEHGQRRAVRPLSEHAPNIRRKLLFPQQLRHHGELGERAVDDKADRRRDPHGRCAVLVGRAREDAREASLQRGRFWSVQSV